LSYLKIAQQNGKMACRLRLVSCASPGIKHRSTKHAAQSPALRNRSVFAGRLLGAAAQQGRGGGGRLAVKGARARKNFST
jgi:hypothetical protein